MFTQHPTLLIGPSDWDDAHAPKAEFEQRIDALWTAFPQATNAIVFGSASRHAELAYLTHFVPKLEPGIALLTRGGAPKLLFGGGPNMIGAMQPLTFIADMAPLGALAKLIDGWTSPLLIGGEHMSIALRKSIDEATHNTALDATAHVRTMMRRKSPSELAAIREACVILNDAMAAIRQSARAGHSTQASVLAGERVAIGHGAQDVRTLFSLDGGRTLRPFEMLQEGHADPLQVYVAVRRHNYWAEGFARFSDQPREVYELAKALLGAALATIKDGQGIDDIAEAVAAAAIPFRDHPVTQGTFVSPMGLSLMEPPRMVGKFRTGEVCSVRIGLTDGGSEHALVSAMIVVRDAGCEALWRSGIV